MFPVSDITDDGAEKQNFIFDFYPEKKMYFFFLKKNNYTFELSYLLTRYLNI